MWPRLLKALVLVPPAPHSTPRRLGGGGCRSCWGGAGRGRADAREPGGEGGEEVQRWGGAGGAAAEVVEEWASEGRGRGGEGARERKRELEWSW